MGNVEPFIVWSQWCGGGGCKPSQTQQLLLFALLKLSLRFIVWLTVGSCCWIQERTPKRCQRHPSNMMSRSIICKNLTLKIYLEWKITSHFKHVFLTNVEIKHFYNITTSFHIQNNKTQIPVKRVGNKKKKPNFYRWSIL